MSLSADKITIRGTDGSLAEPVYVLDGEVVESVEDMDPESIERIDVIKDPEHPLSKKYNAKEGVVLITTKESLELGEENLENESDEPVFYIVEDMPKYPGGKPAMKTFIYSNLEYPENAKNQGIEGEVFVKFLVNEKGHVENAEVVRSSYQGFDAAALKVIREMPDWTPGTQRGKAVKVWFVVPIKFNDEKK
jgi:TonB family protein